MHDLFIILSVISLFGLIVSFLSPLLYRRYYPKKTRSVGDKVSIYRPAFILIFLVFMAFSTMGWQSSRYDSVYPVDTPESESYVKKIYPVYNNSYNLASVIDDNTVVINVRGQASKVKLIGVEKFTTKGSTSSQNSCFAKTAQSKLNTYLKSKEIQLEGDDALNDKDKNDYMLRYVAVNDDNINKKLIADGYALADSKDTGYKYLKEFMAAQNDAKAKKLGLWSGNICQPKRVVASGPTKSELSSDHKQGAIKDDKTVKDHGHGSAHGNGSHTDNNQNRCNASRSFIGSIINGVLFRHC